MAKRFFFVCAGLFLLALTWHLGARSVGAQVAASQEVAVLTGELPHGGTIPLPRFQDGSEALEGECFWIVSQRQHESPAWADFQRCATEGRVVKVYQCDYNCGPAGDCEISDGCGSRRPGRANYLIIAVRNTTPTPSKQATLGQLKQRFHTGGGQ